MHNGPYETGHLAADADSTLTRGWHMGIDARVSTAAYLHLLTIYVPVDLIPNMHDP